MSFLKDAVLFTARSITKHIWWRIDVTVCQIPISIDSPHIWLWLIEDEHWYGVFKKSVNDAYNPDRWGICLLGLEIGSRGNKPPAIPSKPYRIVRHTLEVLTDNLPREERKSWRSASSVKDAVRKT